MEDRMHTITESELVDIINMLAYEDYAKIYRRLHKAGLNRRPTFEEFIDNCAVYEMLASISYVVWRNAYDFIADLFDDNERNGTPCDAEARFNQNINELIMMFNNRN